MFNIDNKIKSILDYSYLVVDDDWTNAFKQVSKDIGVLYNVLYIPYGTYNITEVIWIENKNNISILSDFATIKNTVQDNANSKAGTFYFRYCQGIYLDKIIHEGIDTQKPLSANWGRYGLMFHGCSNIYVHQNHFYYFGDNALLIGRESNTDKDKINGCEYVYVDSCLFESCWNISTTTMGCESYHFINNKLIDMTCGCKFAQRYDLGGDLHIINNYIQGCLDYGVNLGSKAIEINNYTNIIVSGNIIKKEENGIWLSNNGRAKDDRAPYFDKVVISNNIIESFDKNGICLYHFDVDTEDGLKGIWKNITIDNNIIKTDKTNAYGIYVRGREVINLNINNNIVEVVKANFYSTSVKLKDVEGNLIYPSNYYNITGNKFICIGNNGRNILFSPRDKGPSFIISNNTLTSYLGENILINTSSSYIENCLIDSNILNQFGGFSNIQHNLKESTISNNIFNNNKSIGININYGSEVIWCKAINNRFNTGGVGIRTTGSGILYIFANTFNSKSISNKGSVVITTINE